jgi:hypothetical protein
MSDVVFVDKTTGEQVRIVNEDVNFYVLDNSVRIKKDVFMKKYEQSIEVDPNDFFKPRNMSADPLTNLANQIKSLDPSKVNDPPPGGGTQVKYTPPVVLSDTSMSESAVRQPQIEAPIHMTPEEKRAYLTEWAKTQPGAQIPQIQQKDWEEEERRLLNGDKPIEIKPPEPKVDPIEMMFKMFKSNYPVKLKLEIEENIPNPTFIGMVQENVEADAVEYYANLISNKMLQNPSKLKTEIYNQLKAIINKELGIKEEKNNNNYD